MTKKEIFEMWLEQKLKHIDKDYHCFVESISREVYKLLINNELNNETIPVVIINRRQIEKNRTDVILRAIQILKNQFVTNDTYDINLLGIKK